MLNIFKAKDGNLTAEWNGVLLHSSYSPIKEVKKFLDSRLEPNTRTAVILGDPLGHLSREALSRNPSLKIIQISYSSVFSSQIAELNLPCWDPENQMNLYQFLSSHLDDLDLIHLNLIIWGPLSKFFLQSTENFSQIINHFIRERKGSLFTTGGFGKKWLKNTLKNYLSLSCPSLFSPVSNKPIFLAASGYSLNRDIQVLMRYRKNLTLWALPSAALYLHNQGIIPDLIIQTDPGFYTRYHLRPPQEHLTPIAMPLSSSLEYNQFDRPVFLFSQGHFFESFFLNSLGKDYLTLPSTGTVAATAIQLGIFSRPPLFIIGGLDLISHDLHEHVLPNGFFPFLHTTSRRTAPSLTQAYDRTVSHGKKIAKGWQNEQLRTYAEWFNRFFVDCPRNVYRLNPSVIPLNSVPTITGDELADVLSEKLFLDNNNHISTCTISKDKKFLNANKILSFFISTLQEADLTDKISEQARDPRSLIYHLFTYLTLPKFLSIYKNETGNKFHNSQKKLSDLSSEAISILEELKRDYLS